MNRPDPNPQPMPHPGNPAPIPTPTPSAAALDMGAVEAAQSTENRSGLGRPAAWPAVAHSAAAGTPARFPAAGEPVTLHSPPDRAPAPGRVVPPLPGPAGLNSTSGGAADRGRHPASSRQADDVRLSRADEGASEATTRPDRERVGAGVTDWPVVRHRSVTRAAGVQGCPPAARSTRRYAEFLVDGL